MIRSFGSNTERFLLDLERIERRAGRAQMQISTGYTVNTPSDAPDQLVDIVQLQLEISKAAQTKTNLQRVQNEVNHNEALFGISVKILQDVVVAGAQGADDNLTQAGRSLLANRVREWHSELVRIANANYAGRYQFAGDQDQDPPYAVDWTQPGGIIRLHSAEDTRLIEDTNGERFSVSQRAQDIFDLRDSADAFAYENVFDSVHQLSTALEAGDTEVVGEALHRVRSAFDHVNQQHAAYGTVQNRVEAALDAAHGKELRAVVALSVGRDADLSAAVIQLGEANMNLQAAIGAQARAPRTSLFDYLG